MQIVYAFSFQLPRAFSFEKAVEQVGITQLSKTPDCQDSHN